MKQDLEFLILWVLTAVFTIAFILVGVFIWPSFLFLAGAMTVMFLAATWVYFNG